jgi:DNA ligase
VRRDSVCRSVKKGGSNKFREVAASDCEMTVRYGRIGSNGTTKTKQLADADAAGAQADKLIDEKTGKEYMEKIG